MTNLEDLSFTIISLRQQISRLTAERDEARQLYCSLMAEDTFDVADTYDIPVADLEAKEQEIADSLGWDCFKNAPVIKTLKGVVVSKGKAMPPKFELGEDGK